MQAFDAISLRFTNQQFKSYELSATDKTKRIVCPVKKPQKISTIKIKQRNSPEGFSIICGLWLVTKNETDSVKIDLCPGKGQWRIQKL